MQDTLRRLEATLPETTPEQRRLLDELNAQIEENGRYYVVESLTVEQIREHSYDLTEEDGGLIEKIEYMPTKTDLYLRLFNIIIYRLKQFPQFIFHIGVLLIISP